VLELDTPPTLSRAWPTAASFTRPGASVLAEQGLGLAKIQVLGADPDAMFRGAAGLEPPPPRMQADRQGLQLAWMSPNEWLLAGPERRVADALAPLEARDEVLAVDLTHARASFVLHGSGARDVLAALCPLDLHAEAFRVHAVARSLLGDAGLFIARMPDLNDAPRFRLVVDQTMASYAARMLGGPSQRSRTVP
jgi:sarcosine oxidase subunit gamma